MTKRERRRRNYHRARRKLIAEMGHRCFRCKYRWRLQFHHLKIRTWQAYKTSRWVRLARYRREWKEGIVCLACKRCNLKIGRPLSSDEIEEFEIPD